MPELPEVETIVKDLDKIVRGLKITDIWIDPPPFPRIYPEQAKINKKRRGAGWPKMVKKPSYSEFIKQIKNRKILKARRRAKYILIDLSRNKTLIIHQKISGHLLFGKWVIKGKQVKILSNGPLKDDPQNRFIRLIFYLNNGKQLGLSDLRRFAKVLLVDTDKINNLQEIKELGPEPLDKKFTFKKFKEILQNKRGKTKQVLMNQNIIAGIGNIYSDEILFEAKTHPLKQIQELKEDDLERIYNSIKKILRRAIVLRGDSMSDYRDIKGRKGRYQEVQKVYQREGQKCYRCGGIIKRIKISGRSAHFCATCQNL